MSSNGDDDGPTEDEVIESPRRKKRSTRKKPQDPGEKVAGRKPIKVLSPPAIPKLKASRESDIERSPVTININKFFESLPRIYLSVQQHRLNAILQRRERCTSPIVPSTTRETFV